jgi:hypothetical protein
MIRGAGLVIRLIEREIRPGRARRLSQMLVVQLHVECPLPERSLTMWKVYFVFLRRIIVCHFSVHGLYDYYLVSLPGTSSMPRLARRSG